MPNQKLTEYVESRKNQATVILCFRILLQNAIDNGKEATMTKTEIGKAFDEQHSRFGIATFRRDYVLRQAGNDKNAITQHDNLFYIKPDFLIGVSNEELRDFATKIDEYWDEKLAEQQALLLEINEAIGLSTVEEKKQFIRIMLFERETARRGQSFEVTSFSILKTYLRNRGFELNRFSITYSNDGGIDFTAQTAVYQVTAKLDNKKFDEDIKKVPLKQRIFVFKEAGTTFNYSNFDHDLVLDYIGPEELSNYLDYLATKKGTHNLNLILQTMLEEFNREYFQNE